MSTKHLVDNEYNCLDDDNAEVKNENRKILKKPVGKKLTLEQVKAKARKEFDNSRFKSTND